MTIFLSQVLPISFLSAADVATASLFARHLEHALGRGGPHTIETVVSCAAHTVIGIVRFVGNYIPSLLIWDIIC